MAIKLVKQDDFDKQIAQKADIKKTDIILENIGAEATILSKVLSWVANGYGQGTAFVLNATTDNPGGQHGMLYFKANKNAIHLIEVSFYSLSTCITYKNTINRTSEAYLFSNWKAGATTEQLNALFEQNEVLVTPSLGYSVSNNSKKINKILHINVEIAKTDGSDFPTNTAIGNVITEIGSIGSMVAYSLPLPAVGITTGGSYYSVSHAGVVREGKLFIGQITQTGIKKICVVGSAVLR